MNIQTFEIEKVLVLGLPLGKKCHLDVTPMESHIVYYREGSVAFSQRLQDV
jgi:hypothetical protein